jgi:hypothetical protein
MNEGMEGEENMEFKNQYDIHLNTEVQIETSEAKEKFREWPK